ncbi:turripeptide Ici9.2-like isoform X1 [Leptinotarsa decemlineata]|uniref:turripeptide Ici9.2-like n=1 Tax=Leptinotarsa decemlineata TaxID=7539 RepID=UPI003D3056D4
MKTTIVLLIVLVAVLAVQAGPSKGTTKPALKKKPCMKDCGTDYKPVCGGDGTGKGNKSFGSQCVLDNYNCENSQNLKVVSNGECPGGGGVRLQ